MLTPDAVLDRLALGPWRLVGLPTMRGAGIYLVRVEPDGDAPPTFAWFTLSPQLSALRLELRSREEARAFLAKYERGGGYEEALVAAWDEGEEPAPSRIRAALGRVRRILASLQRDPSQVVRVMETRWLEWSPALGWIASRATDDGALRAIAFDAPRAAGEVLTEVLVRSPELEAERPPAEVEATLAGARASRAARFEAHGPSALRLMLWSAEGEPPSGMMRFDDGVYASLRLDADGRLAAVETLPADAAREILFRRYERGELERSLPLSPEHLERASRLRDPEALAAWHATGAIHLRAGEHGRGGARTCAPSTLLDDSTDEEVPVAEAVRPFAGGRGYVAVRVEEQVDPHLEARSEDDAASPNLRYLIPLVWARRLSRQRVFELAFGVALCTALGVDAVGEREETREPDTGDGREPGRAVHLPVGNGAVHLSCSPMQSGIGVHGESVVASFQGLPEGAQLRGSGRLDVRSGGHLELEIEADDAELARRVKAAVLAALP